MPRIGALDVPAHPETVGSAYKSDWGNSKSKPPRTRDAARLQNFIKCFVRESDGYWRCIAPANLELPEGRLQVAPGTVLIKGSRFMNVDVGALLEDEYQRQGRLQ